MTTVPRPRGDDRTMHRAGQAALTLVAALTLQACSSDAPGNGDETLAASATVRPSISAAQLVNDDTRTPGYAQGVAAGVISSTGGVNPAPVSTSDNSAPPSGSGGLPLAVYQQGNAQQPDGGDTGDDGDTTDAGSDGGATGNPGTVNGTDTGADSGTDTDTGSGTDSGTDAGTTGSGDTTTDSGGTGSTTGSDTSTGTDTTTGSDTSTGTDTTTGSDTSTGTDTTTGSDTSTGTDTATGSDTSTGTDTTTGSGEPSLGEATPVAFSSHTTAGFEGSVDADHAIVITWDKDPTARGYNVYRDAAYITTVFDERFVDSDRYDGSYYYEIQAFDFAENFSWWATGLTVALQGSGRVDPNPPATNSGLLDSYELVFSDEFQGMTLDTSKWNTSYLWGPDLVINSEEQYYVDIANQPDWGYDPFAFDGEYLTIRSVPTPAALLDKANGQPYLSGLITSYDAFKFTYGYVETRAKVPYGKGFWAAFWLLNAYYVDDKPEIDIMEHIGDDQDVVYHTYHYYDAAGNLHSTESKPTPGIDYTQDFHTYAVEWKPGTIIYYVDGIERHRVVDPKVSSQEMYILANTALGGWWPGSPNASTGFPGEYTIDYIRAYQKVGVYSDLPIFDDDASALPLADDVRGASPNHIPPFELWPQAYPERQ